MPGRPAKAVNVNSSKMSRDDREARGEAEKRLRGSTSKLNPPKYLSVAQKRLFRNLVAQLEDADILGGTDVYILAQAAISIDRLRTIEEQINGNPDLLLNATFMTSKDKYTRDFFRCCNEMCLSPQSRAKIAAKTPGAQKSDPLMEALEGDDDD